jgi:hypothetical protein
LKERRRWWAEVDFDTGDLRHWTRSRALSIHSHYPCGVSMWRVRNLSQHTAPRTTLSLRIPQVNVEGYSLAYTTIEG